MSCMFCGHNTPHSCWDAFEAANCGNYKAMRERIVQNSSAVAEVERIIKSRSKSLSKEDIEKAERKELQRLKDKYEKD